VLLFLVDRQHRRGPQPDRSAALPVSSSTSLLTEQDGASDTTDPSRGPTRSGRWLRPAGRHAA